MLKDEFYTKSKGIFVPKSILQHVFLKRAEDKILLATLYQMVNAKTETSCCLTDVELAKLTGLSRKFIKNRLDIYENKYNFINIFVNSNGHRAIRLNQILRNLNNKQGIFVDNNILHNKSISYCNKLILSYIKGLSHKYKYCRSSNKAISKYLNIKVDTVYRGVKKLSSLGLIELQQNKTREMTSNPEKIEQYYQSYLKNNHLENSPITNIKDNTGVINNNSGTINNSGTLEFSGNKIVLNINLGAGLSSDDLDLYFSKLENFVNNINNNCNCDKGGILHG